jgi:sphingosine kinase
MPPTPRRSRKEAAASSDESSSLLPPSPSSCSVYVMTQHSTATGSERYWVSSSATLTSDAKQLSVASATSAFDVKWTDLLRVSVEQSEDYPQQFVLGLHWVENKAGGWFFASSRVCKSAHIRLESASNTEGSMNGAPMSDTAPLHHYLSLIWRCVRADNNSPSSPVALCLAVHDSIPAATKKAILATVSSSLGPSRAGRGSFSRDGFSFTNGLKLLIFINPFSGTGSCVALYEKFAAPILKLAGSECEVISTTRANHALDHMRTISDAAAESYDGVVTMGGDGLIWEVLNGVLARVSGKRVQTPASGMSPAGTALLEKLPLGVLPGGTGNGVGKSALFASGLDYGVDHATFLVAKGVSVPLDIAAVDVPKGPGAVLTPMHGGRHYSALSLSWTMIADVDIESEYYRFAGSLRFTLGGIVRMLNLRTYKGKLHYREPLPGGTKVDAEGDELLPPLDSPLNKSKKGDRWKVIEGEFQLLWATNTSHAAHDMHQCPGTNLSGGSWKILVVQRMSACDFFNIFTGQLEAGSHVHKNPTKVKLVECDAFRLIPEPPPKGALAPPWGKPPDGVISLDGERVPYGICQVQVYDSVARIFCLNR